MTKQLVFLAEHRGFAFRPPQWRPRDQVNTRTGALTFVTIIWLNSSAMLALFVMKSGEYGLSGVYIATIILAAIGLALLAGWRNVLRHWRRRIRRGPWPALSRRQLQRLSPSEFEAYVADRLFARHGYKVENTPDSRDGGIDVIVIDPAGRRAIVQCKRYRGTVGTPAVRDLYGTVMHSDADVGYLIATGRISKAAKEWATGKQLVLIDGDRLMRISRSEPETLPSH